MTGSQELAVGSKIRVVDAYRFIGVVQAAAPGSHVARIQQQVFRCLILQARIEVLGVSKMQCLWAD